MNIISITAGAAGMYCGSCIRDNALAAELKAQGHQLLLVPIYTPTLTDEDNVSEGKVLFGGISVYLEQHSSLFRKTPRFLDRLWDSTAALKLASRGSIAVNPTQLGELTVSMLKGENGNQRKEVDKMLDWLRGEPRPDLVTLPNSMLISLAEPIRKALGRPICCTLQGEDLFLDGLAKHHRDTCIDLIRAAVSHVDGFAAISEFYAESMCRMLRIPDAKMHVLPLGINLAGYDPTPLPRDRFTVGYFARVAPEKGLHVLADAYRLMRRRPNAPAAALQVAGYMAPEHRPYLQKVEATLREAGLSAEFHYHGVVDREQKIAFLRGLDVLSVPATYDEPKGLFLLEAFAAGVPVVQPRRGAFPEILAKTQGGLLVEPDNPKALADALQTLADDPPHRQRLARQAAEGVRQHYPVARMAARAIEVYTAIATGARAATPC
jgi:glycosyltransferase involved in cell wall biosynthesis